MRHRSRRSLLHNYELDASTSVRVEARSEAHDLAHMRMRHQDVKALRNNESICRPIIALFSTDNTRTPVSLRSDERLYVRLPEETSATTDEEHEDTATDRAATDRAATDRAATDRAATDRASATEKRHEQAARKRALSVWTPLRVLAHHSCVAGMRVSGVVHRAIVRLQPERA